VIISTNYLHAHPDQGEVSDSTVYLDDGPWTNADVVPND
jgi:hypothetical protein